MGKDEPLDEQRQLLAVELMAGHRAAAERFVDEYYQRIYLYFRRMGYNQQVSEDLTQDSFLQAFGHIGQLRYAGALSSWLYSIAANVARQYWRKNRNNVSINDIDIEISDGNKNGSAESAGHIEELSRLRDAIGKLPIKLKETVVLHYLQHLSITESADVTGISQGTFKSRLHRALRVLRRNLPE